MNTSLEGHVAVVTGAAMGIGKEVAKTLAERGASVACWDIVEAKVQETASEIQASGNKALGLHVDVTDSTQVQHALKHTVEALGTVDILVNVAGGSRGAPPGLDNLTEADWDRVVNLNMRAPFLTCKAVAGMMKDKGWGRIVNIASGAGRSYSRSGVIPYAAAKAGVLGLTRQLAVELAPHGVIVNAVSPGAIDSVPNGGWTRRSPEAQRDVLLTIPIKRFGQSEEIATAVAFMVSDDASYVVGQTLCVDGGHWMF
jgi:3-oxoacyl-[acyl-carrier protein] reductase